MQSTCGSPFGELFQPAWLCDNGPATQRMHWALTRSMAQAMVASTGFVDYERVCPELAT